MITVFKRLKHRLYCSGHRVCEWTWLKAVRLFSSSRLLCQPMTMITYLWLNSDKYLPSNDLPYSGFRSISSPMIFSKVLYLEQIKNILVLTIISNPRNRFPSVPINISQSEQNNTISIRIKDSNKTYLGTIIVYCVFIYTTFLIAIVVWVKKILQNSHLSQCLGHLNYKWQRWVALSVTVRTLRSYAHCHQLMAFWS